MIGIGIDFGTSNSAAAYFDGAQVHLVTLEDSEAIMPTATHLDRELKTTTGEEAVRLYIEENCDRIVELTPEIIGRSQLLVSEADVEDPHSEAGTTTAAVYGQPYLDRGMPGRLFRGVKRLLGNSRVRRLLVFDHYFRLVALITPILLRVRRTLEASLSEAIGDVHVGHPVRFEGRDARTNELALTRLGEACHHAGLKTITFYPEPVAATLSYLHDEAHGEKGKVLTVDFGGGTLDLSVVSYQGMSFSVMSTAGLSLGGDHIDQLIFRELLFPLLGKGETWSRIKDGVLIENEFPFDEFEDKLLHWAVTYTLNQNRYRSMVADCVKKGGPAVEKFERLDDLITHNYSYLVFQAIKDAKAALSTRKQTILDVPELDIRVEFSRSRLESMMSEMLESIDRIVDSVVRDAGLGNEEIDLVIRTGGSSQIASVKHLLEDKFPGRVVEHDPFTSVAAGLAIASFNGYQFIE